MKDLHKKRAKVETRENQHLGDSGEEESVREAKSEIQRRGEHRVREVKEEQNLEEGKNVINRMKFRQDWSKTVIEGGIQGHLRPWESRVLVGETEADCSRLSWILRIHEITFEETNFLGASMQEKAWVGEEMYNSGRVVLVTAVLWLNTVESANKVGVSSHQKRSEGMKVKVLERGMIWRLEFSEDLESLSGAAQDCQHQWQETIKALDVYLMGIKAKGRCSAEGELGWLEKEKGNERTGRKREEGM